MQVCTIVFSHARADGIRQAFEAVADRRAHVPAPRGS